MKPGLLINFYKIFDVYKPANICEVGTHNAKTAVQMCEYLLAKGLDVHYTGYDMFDLADDAEFHKAEHNGKGPGSLDRATRMLEHVKKRYPKFKYKLIKGNTNDTLITSEKYDFAFIDGGHTQMQIDADVRAVFPYLADDCILLFHDHVDVSELTKEFIRYNGFINEKNYHTGFNLYAYSRGNKTLI